MSKLYIFFFVFFSPFCNKLFADTYPEVLFENSLMPRSYYYSQSTYTGNSWIGGINGHLPVADSIYFTPGNALLLDYISGSTGTWESRIHYNQSSGYLAKNTDLLVFKLFINSDTKVNELPQLKLLQGELLSQAINLAKYISNYQDNMWLSVEIPLKEVNGLDFNAAISGIQFIQGGRDGKEHHVFLDQIECIPAKTPEMKLTGKAVLSSASAYERHVDISWLLPLTPSIRYIKIYRSEDNKNFTPVGIRPITYSKYTDIVPRTNATYYYKIAWVDYKYRESPFSDVKEVQTKTATDEELLDMVERSHIDYFTEQTEFNSGMHKISPLVSDARVSVKSTGLGILAQLVGAERKFVPRTLLIERLNKITKFLGKAERYQGAYPEVLDGRTGEPVAMDSCAIEADLKSTAYLMQALLVARNYFKGDNQEEKELRDHISQLWGDVDWHFFLKNEGSHLYSSWSPACRFKQAQPLGGYNDSFLAYFLGIASPSHAIPPISYQLGFKQPLRYVGSAMGRFSSNPTDTLIKDEDLNRNEVFSKMPFARDTTVYGMQFLIGDTLSSLIDYQQLFLAFDPKEKRDGQLEYYQNQQRVMNYYYRKSLDQDEQYVSLTNAVWPYTAVDSTKSMLFAPASALATYAYTPTIAMDALKNYYRSLGAILWTEYGFRDLLDLKHNWVSDTYDPVDQAVVPIMLENARTGLIWRLFMADSDIQKATQSLFGKK